MDRRDNDNGGTTSCGSAALCTHCIPTYSPETQASIKAALELCFLVLIQDLSIKSKMQYLAAAPLCVHTAFPPTHPRH